MATCRVCGVECREDELLPVHDGGGCRTCNGSPACARCGHARRQHRGTFGGGPHRCDARVAADGRLVVGRCGCAGYTTDRAAFGEVVELVDLSELRLRAPGEAGANGQTLAPVRDLFDEGRSGRGPDEPIPWRPRD